MLTMWEWLTIFGFSPIYKMRKNHEIFSFMLATKKDIFFYTFSNRSIGDSPFCSKIHVIESS